MVNRRPQLELIAPSASPAQAAAIVAALERFMRDTAPPVAPAPDPLDPWLRAAMLEGVSRQIYGSRPPEPDPWLNT
ncbi:MAG TPA: hypothetical protein VGY30_10875 [Solirubrobacteraceae bacterium]|jgi:hypothetical protein|nr:hypothetical protein [Solirubrobacteraceae bacterium]